VHVAAVTGAFSFSGRVIARRLLERGFSVRTLTNRRPDANAPALPAFPLQFDDREALVESLQGVDTLYNTYWIRFPYGELTFGRAVANSLALLEAAKEAGVGRVVHLSIANLALAAELPYYQGKARVEQAIAASGLAHAFIRPTVMFGSSDSLTDVLVNNVAWFLRRLPLVAVPGPGSYGIQPVSVEDIADLSVEAGLAEGNVALDAAGPEIFTFEELVRLIGAAIGHPRRCLHLPPGLLYGLLRLLQPALDDIVLTREEVSGLMAGLLVSHEEARGKVAFSAWLRTSASTLGRRYASELARHYRGRVSLSHP
jgi:NADH dehydrogenase